VKIAVILNAGAGVRDKDEIPKQVRELFRVHGVEAKIFVAESGKMLAPSAQQAISEGFDMIVAGGGDGTISAVAAVVASSTARFGVLPLGTLNHFAKDLHIPLKLEESIDTILSGVPRKVDVATVNDRIFLNNSSLGLYPKIVEDRERQQLRGAKKWTAFFRSMFRVLAKYPYVSVRIAATEQPRDVEGKTAPTEIVRRSPMVFVGNNIYEIHGLDIGSRERLDEGKLCLFVTKRVSRLALAWLALRGIFGFLSKAEEFDSLTATEFTIESHHRELEVSLDGEVVRMKPPLTYTVRPGALTIMAPATKE
jgi:YegS/Rv2252/BmrU family lipid kinase